MLWEKCIQHRHTVSSPSSPGQGKNASKAKRHIWTPLVLPWKCDALPNGITAGFTPQPALIWLSAAPYLRLEPPASSAESSSNGKKTPWGFPSQGILLISLIKAMVFCTTSSESTSQLLPALLIYYEGTKQKPTISLPAKQLQPSEA